MEKTSYIHNVLLYIEEHLTEELNPDRIARRHFISLVQLYRDFYKYTGHSVKEYIRKRRISNACKKIKCSDIPLAIIANESGCQTQQAFNKMFKCIVGMTPLEYKQCDTYFYFYPYSIDEISIAVKVGNEFIPECQTIRFYDSCLIGIEDKAIAGLNDIKGRIFGRNGKQIGNQFCYEVITEKDGIGKTGTYATCVINYNEQDINDGWNYLYNVWLSSSMFEQSCDAYFEEYLFFGGKVRKLKLFLPVKKRKTAQHISISRIPEMDFIIACEKGNHAERKASEKVMNFLKEQNPLLIKNARRFYVCTHDDVYVCGVECCGTLKLPDDSDLKILHVPGGNYAILPDDCLGDINVGRGKMDLWLQNNSIDHENAPVFAVYETLDGKYDTDNIRLKLYKQLKYDKNG
ncbi:MAG TPA: hypothetical protein DDZ89_17855 [Clostridiales bacterium]|nr:hypothetical protein [Clostridiales bacterium]